MPNDAAFPGFPARTEATAVPAAFFSEVLPALDDLLELKVFLVALRRIQQRKGPVRWVSDADLRAAPELAGNPAQSIAEAAAAAASRGLLVPLPLAGNGDAAPGGCAYFLNDPEGRKAVALARAGAPEFDGGAVAAASAPGGAQPPPLPRTIFRLYEDTIGPIPGARIAEELADAETSYPEEWITEAFGEAAAQNVRRWAYVRAILARWRDEGGKGPTDGTPERRAAKGKYRTGRYGGVVRWD